MSNGIQVIVKTDKNLKDDIQFNLQLPGGRSLETQQTAGLTDWALKLLKAAVMEITVRVIWLCWQNKTKLAFAHTVNC